MSLWQTGSKLYNAAQNLSEYFEELLEEKYRGRSRFPPLMSSFSSLDKDLPRSLNAQSSSRAVIGPPSSPVSLTSDRLSPEELSQVVSLIEQKCPSALRKVPPSSLPPSWFSQRADDNEIMIDIDVISSPVFHEITSLLSSLSSAAVDPPAPTASSKKRGSEGGAKNSSGSSGAAGDSLASIKKRKAT
jgi:hypothetical protein